MRNPSNLFKQTSGIHIFTTRKDLLPYPFFIIRNIDEAAVFQYLVLEKRACLPENDEVNVTL
jgi:hypothetical protein